MTYKALNNVYVDGEVKSVGSTFTLTEEAAKPLLERGSIAEYDENATEEDAPVEVRSGETVEEFTLNDNTFTRLFDAAGVFYLLNNVEEIDENAFVNAKQALVQVDLDASKAESQEVETASDPLVPPTDGLSDDQNQIQTDQTDTQAPPASSSTNLHLG